MPVHSPEPPAAGKPTSCSLLFLVMIPIQANNFRHLGCRGWKSRSLFLRRSRLAKRIQALLFRLNYCFLATGAISMADSDNCSCRLRRRLPIRCFRPSSARTPTSFDGHTGVSNVTDVETTGAWAGHWENHVEGWILKSLGPQAGRVKFYDWLVLDWHLVT